MSGKTKKAIEKVIMFKMMGWLNSIDDKELREKVKADLIVSGGCIASMLLGEEVNDYDVYLRNPETAQKLAEFYIKKLGEVNNDRVSSIKISIQPTGHRSPEEDELTDDDPEDTADLSKLDADFLGDMPVAKTVVELDEVKVSSPTKQLKIAIKSTGLAGGDVNLSQYRYFESLPFSEVTNYFAKGFKTQSKKSYQLLFMSSNAISLSDGIQIITRFIGEPEDIHKCFDFVHVKNYFTFKGGLVLNAEAMESLLSKQLVYNHSMYPVSTIFRMRKFIRRGWSITAGEMFKIMYDISKLDLNCPGVLMEQLTGADVAYFHQVLSMLQGKTSKDVSQTYLFALIDRVFKTNEDIMEKDYTPEEMGDVATEIREDAEAIALGLEDEG